MTIVVLILGVLAGVATPRYLDAVGQSCVEAAARRLAADLRYTRSEALRTSQARSIEFSVVDERYFMNGIVDPDRSTRRYEVTLSESPYEVQLDSADFAGSAVLTFDVYGKPSSAGEVRLAHGVHRVSVLCDDFGNIAYGTW